MAPPSLARTVPLLIAAAFLGGCASPPEEQHQFPDPFAGKGIPIDGLEAVRLADVNASRDHPTAKLSFVMGNEWGNSTGKSAPWDVFYTDLEANLTYWYVVAGQGPVTGARPSYPPPPGFPTAPLPRPLAFGTVRAVEVGKSGPDFVNSASGPYAHLRYSLTSENGKALWQVGVEGPNGQNGVRIDAQTGERA